MRCVEISWPPCEMNNLTSTKPNRRHSYPMPPGCALRRPRRHQADLPKGGARIAQPFKVGNHVNPAISPEGTADARFIQHPRFSRPFGTYLFRARTPNLERLGYCHSSLRDEPAK